MARRDDCIFDAELKDLMEGMATAFPVVFEGFDVTKIKTIKTPAKSPQMPVRVHRVGYPREAFVGCPYIVEAFLPWWAELTDKQKRLAIFHVMCYFPQGAFDQEGNEYGKLRRPDFTIFRDEFAVTGGVPDWMENPAARDPADVAKQNAADAEAEEEDQVKRVPVTKQAVQNAPAKATTAQQPAA